MTIFALLALLLTAAPAAASTRARHAAPDSVARREMAEFLMRHWVVKGGFFNRMPMTSYHLDLRRPGHFHRWNVSDVLEFDDKGAWDFRLVDDTSGVIAVDADRHFWFARRGDRLWFDGRLYEAVPRGAETVEEWTPAKAAADSMRDVLSRLTVHPWYRRDEFNLFMEPQRIDLHPDLTCDLVFRDGACRQRGRFSIDRGSLLFEVAGPGCDLRGGFNLFENRTVPFSFDGSQLLLSGAYYSGESVLGRRRAYLGLPHGPLALIVEYEGPLRAGRSQTLYLEFRNDGDHAVRLDSLRIAEQPLKPSHGGFVARGPEAVVTSKPYPAPEVAPGKSYRDALQVRLPLAGDEISMEFEWYSRGRGQTYHSRPFNLVRVR